MGSLVFLFTGGMSLIDVLMAILMVLKLVVILRGLTGFVFDDF